MAAIKQEGNAAGEPLFTLAADKKTLDYSKPHGWTTNVQGHSGHEHNPFKETATANKNVMWANDKAFLVYSNGNKCTNENCNVSWKDVAGKVLFSYHITKGRCNSTNSTT